MTRRKAAAWGAAGGSLLALELHGIYTNDEHGNGDGDTLSEMLRRLPRLAFLAGWISFNAWFLPHVLKQPKGRKS